jgi:hypothetical protein
VQRATAVTGLAMLREALLLFASSPADATQLLHKAVCVAVLVRETHLTAELSTLLSLLAMQYPACDIQLHRLAAHLQLPTTDANNAPTLALSTPGLPDLDDDEYEALALSMQAVLDRHFADFAESYREFSWQCGITHEEAGEEKQDTEEELTASPQPGAGGTSGESTGGEDTGHRSASGTSGDALR